ncbi:hypothetical protein Ddc_16900 [Ditylenchus destructor]|nr:hypothetical protein Ddc_16900 [Ditylenchus destructor]
MVGGKNIANASKPADTFPQEIAQIMPALNLLKEKDVKRVAEIFLTNKDVQGEQLEEYVEIAYDKWLSINNMYKGDVVDEPNNLPCKIRKIVPPNNDKTSLDGEFAFACENQNKEVLGYIAYGYGNSQRWIYVSEIWVHLDYRRKSGNRYHIAQKLVERFEKVIKAESKVRRVYVQAIHKGSEKLFRDIGFTEVSGEAEMWEKFYTPEYHNVKDNWIEMGEIRGSAKNEIICKVRLQNPVITSKTADKIEDLMRLYPKLYRKRFRNYSFGSYYFRRVLVCEKEETGEYLAYIGYEDIHGLFNEMSVDEMKIVAIIIHEKYIGEIGNKFLEAWDGLMKKHGKVKKVKMQKSNKEEINELIRRIGFEQPKENTLEKIYRKEPQAETRAEDKNL